MFEGKNIKYMCTYCNVFAYDEEKGDLKIAAYHGKGVENSDLKPAIFKRIMSGEEGYDPNLV